MNISNYFQTVQMPAYTAVEAMRRAGIPVNEERAKAQMELWTTELEALEKEVEDEAAKKGFVFKYSAAHGIKPAAQLREFLYSPKGLGLDVRKVSEKTEKPSTDDEALKEYAAVGSTHREDDHPIVYKILKIRSISKARNTHLNGLLKWRASDGCCHPKARWNLPNSTRLSMEDPAAQQLPERADPEIAKLVKHCIVPRDRPWLGNPDDWDPRRHGWCAKVDVKGAEAVIRAGCIARCRVSTPYLRGGGDIHSKTASIIYDVREGTYTKGSYQRDSVSKTTYFQLIYGGSWKGLQRQLWKEARIWLEDDDAKKLHANFFKGYHDIELQIEEDKELIWSQGYIEDDYGRRWNMPPTPGAVRGKNGRVEFPGISDKDELKAARSRFSHIEHCYSNRRTQCDQGTTTLWCIALCYHGEYVDLQTCDYWKGELIFPEAAHWQLNGGTGPGGKPLLAWMNNCVHDSIWLDGAPGTLEPAIKTVVRRCNGVPFQLILDSNLPWRVDVEVGPDLGHLYPYQDVAKRFGLEPLPER